METVLCPVLKVGSSPSCARLYSSKAIRGSEEAFSRGAIFQSCARDASNVKESIPCKKKKVTIDQTPLPDLTICSFTPSNSVVAQAGER